MTTGRGGGRGRGPFKCYVTQMGDVIFSGKKRYEGVRFNVITVTRGWVGVKFPGKKHYITLELSLSYGSLQENNNPIDYRILPFLQ